MFRLNILFVLVSIGLGLGKRFHNLHETWMSWKSYFIGARIMEIR